MKHIAIVTLFEAMFQPFIELGVVGRAIEAGKVAVSFWNPRNYAEGAYRKVDDRPYGGGPGMVMMAEPLIKAIAAAQQTIGDAARVIYLSPQGRLLVQSQVKQLAEIDNLILIAGRYEGIDERVIENYIDEEWSIGDYVVSGGELPAMVLMDAVLRLQPGVLGHELSAEQDSFSAGLLDYPHYTRPENLHGQAVPEVLLSGDHQAIAQWRANQALQRTQQRRPDLLSVAKKV